MQDVRIQIFSNVHFCEWYSKLSEVSRKIELRLNDVDKDKVISIFEKLGYSAKFVSRGRFYKISDESKNWLFNIHFSIKNGLIEIIYGLKKNDSPQGLGGSAASICEDIRYFKGIDSTGLIKDPTFDSYETLENILKQALEMYEQIKKEALSHPV